MTVEQSSTIENKIVGVISLTTDFISSGINIAYTDMPSSRTVDKSVDNFRLQYTSPYAILLE